MARSGFLNFLDGYENPDENRENVRTGRRFFCRNLTGSVTPVMFQPTRRRTAKFFAALTKKIQYISAKAYGAMSLAFGLITIILSFLEDYGSATGEATTISFIIGVAFALISIPLLLADEPLVFIFQNSRLIDALLFDFLCINRIPRSSTGVKSVPIAVMAVLGALLAFCGYFIPVWYVIFIFCIVVFVYLTFGSPEFSFLSMLFVLPYISLMKNGGMVILFMTALTLVSFIRKVVSGKRVFSFEQYDVIILLLSIVTLVSGIVNKGTYAFTASVVSVGAMFVYFLAGNLITNRRLADSVLGSVVVSSIIPTAFAYYTLIRALIDGNASDIMSSGVSSTFAAPEIFAAFLLVSVTFGFALIKQSHGFGRIINSAFVLINIGALVMCARPFAVLALVLGMFVYSALKMRNMWSSIVCGAMSFVPYLAVLLMSLFGLGGESLTRLVGAWRISLEAIGDNILLGIGACEKSFAVRMEEYGATAAADSSNIFIESGLCAGIFGMILLVLILIVRIRHRYVYNPYIKHSQISKLSPAVATATFCLVAYGAASSIISDPSVHCLFWCVFGLGSATLRVAKKEYDDRILYFEYAIDSESSVVDVKIS